MPVSVLTPEPESRYGQFPAEGHAEQLARFLQLRGADRAFMLGHRDAQMRLGRAIQLGAVRLLGTFVEDPCKAPPWVMGITVPSTNSPAHKVRTGLIAVHWDNLLRLVDKEA